MDFIKISDVAMFPAKAVVSLDIKPEEYCNTFLVSVIVKTKYIDRCVVPRECYGGYADANCKTTKFIVRIVGNNNTPLFNYPNTKRG